MSFTVAIRAAIRRPAKRPWLLAALAFALFALPLAFPGLRWRICGWWREEPFWGGLPASYWREQVSEFKITIREWNYDHRKGQMRMSGRYALAYSHLPVDSAFRRFGAWLDESMGGAIFRGATSLRDIDSDPAATPVLLSLAADPEPRIRAYALMDLGCLGFSFPNTRVASRPALLRALQDAGELDGNISKVKIRDLIADQISWLKEGQ